ncbi:uncharacterized protein At2g29880-like [Zingiber officinale]|uniref:uncharacterized protein At2g29880-like n=1 Tax=Zingiber officinale TaxID=94328 RepID=UPI001C4B7E7C|nr:uncharacterized protein At2g29880-like [Zingiber officinale]
MTFLIRDPETKKVTDPEEIWKDYFKSHPKDEHYRTDTFEDYEYLRIAVGNGTATRKYSMGLGYDTDARTLEVEGNRSTTVLDDYVFDHNTSEFVQSDRQKLSDEPSFFKESAPPLPSQPISLEVNPTTKK